MQHSPRGDTSTKIAVISDNFNSLGTAPADIESGDLAGVGNPNGFTIPIAIVDDVDPDNARTNEAIRDLADPNISCAHISVGGVGLSDEPYWQDGLIYQAIDGIVANGVAYRSSTGNEGSAGYESAFRGSQPTVEAIHRH